MNGSLSVSNFSTSSQYSLQTSAASTTNNNTGSTCCCLVIQNGIDSQNIQDCLDFYYEIYPESKPKNVLDKKESADDDKISICSSSSSSINSTTSKRRKKYLKQRLREKRKSGNSCSSLMTTSCDSAINIFKDSYRQENPYVKRRNSLYVNRQKDQKDDES